MTRAALKRLLFFGGIAVALLGVYAASRTAEGWKWDSYVAIAIIAVGAYMATVGLVMLVGFGQTAGEIADDYRIVLPDISLPLLYGGFIGLISLVAGLVAGHYQGRNAGFLTFIFAFVVANLLFGLPLALARSGANL